MVNISIPTRPFASDIIIGLMLPDGIFEASLGKQRLNAQFRSGSAQVGLSFYVESVSHPGIIVTPATYNADLGAGATRLLTWDIDVSAAPPGEHLVSFITSRGGDTTRVIKKIFVTRVTFDPATTTFSAETPEGTIAVRFRDFIKPGKHGCCGGRKGRDDRREQAPSVKDRKVDVVTELSNLFRGHDRNFEFCLPGYLPTQFDLVITPTPPFAGQHGDLPFQDPWWKVVLCIIAVILLIAAAIAAAQSDGEVIVTTGGGDGGADNNCCGVEAEGGSSSYVVAGLVAAAAAAALAAQLSDERDAIRRGQDNTVPMAGELTTAEELHAELQYIEPIALGRPFKVGTKWAYTRVTTGNTYTHNVAETNENVHVLKEYVIKAADVVRVYRRELWTVEGRFIGVDGKPLRGGALFVQCFLAGPEGQFRSFVLQDDGQGPDKEPNDGIYTGVYQFAFETKPQGLWRYYVIAQDVNAAKEGLDPEKAAQTIGGFVVTHQLAITFDPASDCPFVPDGHVNVI